MSQLIKRFSDSSFLEFDKGIFDDWCVYLVSPEGARTAPKDLEYFNSIVELADRYGKGTLYVDFLKIYFDTDREINPEIIKTISELSGKYNSFQLLFDKVFTIIYAGMIAEENKKNAILKKRIKHLGIYQLLVENKSAEYAANFSRGKSWKELDNHCSNLGF